MVYAFQSLSNKFTELYSSCKKTEKSCIFASIRSVARFAQPRSLIGWKFLQNCTGGAGACVHSPSAAGHRQGEIKSAKFKFLSNFGGLRQYLHYKIFEKFWDEFFKICTQLVCCLLQLQLGMPDLEI